MMDCYVLGFLNWQHNFRLGLQPLTEGYQRVGKRKKENEKCRETGIEDLMKEKTWIQKTLLETSGVG